MHALGNQKVCDSFYCSALLTVVIWNQTCIISEAYLCCIWMLRTWTENPRTLLCKDFIGGGVPMRENEGAGQNVKSAGLTLK